MLKVKSLKEVSSEIGEELGIQKEFKRENGYFIKDSIKPEIRLIDNKIHVDMFHRDKKNSELSSWHFKSESGYNSKYKKNKQYANHYAEYIAYLILKQLGKKVCKAELGEIEIRNRYSNKPVEVQGVVTRYEIAKNESIKEIKRIVEEYKRENPEEYKEMTVKGKTKYEKNYTNIEIILKSLEYLYTKNGQKDKIPGMRKEFFDMCIFDLMFANRDRADDNFGVKVNQDTNEIEYYALYDNEQILGMQEEKKDIVRYMSNEKEYKRFKEKYLTSFIGVPEEVQRTTPEKLLRHMLENYYEETIDSLEDIGRYKFSDLEEVLEVCPELSKEHKLFAKKIFIERQKEISKVLKEYEQKKDEQIR